MENCVIKKTNIWLSMYVSSENLILFNKLSITYSNILDLFKRINKTINFPLLWFSGILFLHKTVE